MNGPKKCSIDSSPPNARTSFWSVEIDWRRIWRVRWWVLVVLGTFYILGVTVNSGPSMNHLGWVYCFKWFTQPTSDGDIFVFVPANKPAWTKYIPGRQWIKRRVGISKGCYIFEGDNEDWSTDNRDLLEPVPPSHVAGTLYCAISPKRLINCFTTSGRMKNRADFTGPLHHQEWSHDNRYVAINNGCSFQIYGIHGEKIFGRGRCVRWQGNKALVVASDPKFPADDKIWLVDVNGSRTPANSWGVPKNGVEIKYATPTQHNPNRVFDGFDNFGWGVDIETDSPRNVALRVEIPSLSVKKLRMVSFPANSLEFITIKVNGREVKSFQNRGIHPEDKAAFPLGDISADPILRCFRIISNAEINCIVKKITIEIQADPDFPVSIMVNEVYLE